MIRLVFKRVENNAGKGENVGYQHFLLVPHCFQMPVRYGTSKYQWLLR